MEKCSFLSTYEGEVSCFKECPFYCNEESDSTCPFKSVTGKSKNNVKRLYQYYVKEDNITSPKGEVETEVETELAEEGGVGLKK